MSECAACEARDTAVRRSILLARNLPTIEPSADFAARLAARIDDVRCGRCDVPDDDVVPMDWAPTRTELLRTAVAAPFGGSRLRMAAVAASLLALTYAGSQAFGDGADGRDVALPPVVASTPEASIPEALPIFPPALATPALVSTAATGIPVWPAALLADQAPSGIVQANLTW